MPTQESPVLHMPANSSCTRAPTKREGPFVLRCPGVHGFGGISHVWVKGCIGASLPLDSQSDSQLDSRGIPH